MTHAPADKGIVSVKAQGQSLAVIYLITHEIVDQPGKLGFGRRTQPGAVELGIQLLNLAGTDHDSLWRISTRGLRHLEQQEKTGADHQEMDQRLTP